ncbi:MAG TPA: methionyl-tRNA formyltransferase [Myxococcales bacterium]|nr:methionyl-tRNA formyltransferase [Myxococcales bacterium]
MRIAFLGTPEFALPVVEACAAAGELWLVVAQPDRPVGRSGLPQPPATVRWARARGVPVQQPERVKQGRLAALLQGFDVAVVAAYGRIVPPDALAAPRLGCINVHASLLPELRGAAPAQWAVARRYRETGVTIMQMDEGLDTGDILLQRKLRIAPDETGESLLGKLSALGAHALLEALPQLEKLPRTPQDHSKATLAPILTRDDGKVDFGRTADECDARRRGFTPWPGAWTTLRGHVLKIHAAEPILQSANQPPGEILKAGQDGIWVACAGSVWRLLELQLEGKKRLAAGPFLSGTRLAIGDRFGS